MVSVPVSGTVARYRVGFRTADGSVIAHVDRRADGTAARHAPAGSTPWVRLKRSAALVSTAVVMTLAVMSAQERPTSGEREQFRFRSGVELINVTATVSDGRGRFVSDLRQDDFRIYEDGELRPITHFTAERVPVSLSIVLDTSGSMEGEKILAAKRALQRFLFELLGEEDEVLLYRFDNRPELVHGWTRNKEEIAAELRRIQPRGATTLYDAVAEAIPLTATGRNRKKALLIISDGNDSSSYTRIEELKRLIRESEVLVYAIGIDAMTQSDALSATVVHHVGAATADAVPVSNPGRRTHAATGSPDRAAALPTAANSSPGGGSGSRRAARDETRRSTSAC